MVTVSHKMVRLERMLDYRGAGLQRLRCIAMILTVTCTIDPPLIQPAVTHVRTSAGTIDILYYVPDTKYRISMLVRTWVTAGWTNPPCLAMLSVKIWPTQLQ